jgi:ribonuclease D
MHGADYDLRLLDRDLGVQLAGLFDTQIAAAMLGKSALGLAALLETHLGVKLSKKYQRADWAQRPLDEGMLEYAASDTRYLMELADILTAELRAAKRESWAVEEAQALQSTVRALRDEPELEPEDPVGRVKGARDLPPRDVHALRVALMWRDELARARDRAPFRVVGDAQLLEAVRQTPEDRSGLRAIKGFPRGLAREDGDELLRRFRQVAELPDEELIGYPRFRRRGPGRPPPEVEEVAERLKSVRNQSAQRLQLDRGTLLPNALITAIALENPSNAEALAGIAGVRGWQVAVAGEALLEALRRTG